MLCLDLMGPGLQAESIVYLLVRLGSFTRGNAGGGVNQSREEFSGQCVGHGFDGVPALRLFGSLRDVRCAPMFADENLLGEASHVVGGDQDRSLPRGTCLGRAALSDS